MVLPDLEELIFNLPSADIVVLSKPCVRPTSETNISFFLIFSMH